MEKWLFINKTYIHINIYAYFYIKNKEHGDTNLRRRIL